MKGYKNLVKLVFFCCSFTTSALFAYDQPAVNLGYTSFFDGSPPAGPGLYFQNYFQYYSANRLNDNHGDRLPLPQTGADVTANIVQLIYLSNFKIGKANIGISALLPWVLHVNVNDGLNNTILKGQDGAGDLFIGPALQFEPIMRSDGQGPFFVQRFELDFVAPVGRYNNYYAINPSSNFWSLNPYWAFTIWTTPKWSSSMRLHYLWNAKNSHPNIAFGPAAYSMQAGQAIFADIATNYEINKQFYVGINGYFFNQFTDTKVNGVGVAGRQEKVWAIGPGLLWGITKNDFIFLNVYFEQDARNRPQGNNGILRYVHHFT